MFVFVFVCLLVVLLSESQFNVELVVQCVRVSSSPQTHHLALLLLTSAAELFPVSPHLCTSLLSIIFILSVLLNQIIVKVRGLGLEQCFHSRVFVYEEIIE